MTSNGLNLLTEGQKECLRLVFEHRQSKEIARILGIAKATVDQRIDAARQKLGGISRVEAARILAAHEGRRTPDPILYDPIPVPTAPETPLPIEPVETINPPLPGVLSKTHWPWGTKDRRENDYDLRQRLIVMATIALLSLLAITILVSVMNGLGGLVRR